jgi:glutaminyl-tRNA synthetase
MLVLDPIPVVIENLPDDFLEMIELPFSKEPEFGVCTSSTLLLERMSSSISRTAKGYFKETDLLIRCILFHSPKRSTSTGPTFVKKLAKDFLQLTPGTSVGLLKVPFPITATSFDKDPASGLVVRAHATYERPEDGSKFKKPKT